MLQKLLQLLVSFLTLLFFISPVSAQSQQNPPAVQQPQTGVQIEIKNPSFEKGNLTAEIAISSNSQISYYQNIYNYQLQSPPKSTNFTVGGRIIPGQSPGEIFSFGKSELFDLPAGATRRFTIKANLGEHLPTGTYILAVGVIGQAEAQVAYQTTSANITGDGNWVTIAPGSCQIFDGTRTFLAGDGPVITDPSKAYFQCVFENNGENDVQAQYNLTYAMGSVDEHAAIELIGPRDGGIIPAGQTKQIQFLAPAIQTPQVYEAFVSLVDSGNTTISPTAVFRWTVPGASANIYDVLIDKPSYQQGDAAIITAQVDPSMDLWWRAFPGEVGSTASGSAAIGTDLIGAKFVVKITNNSDVLCGEKSLFLPSTTGGPWEPQQIEVPISRDCDNVKVNLTIENDNKPLFTVNKFMGTQNQGFLSTKTAMVAGGILLLVLAIGGFIYWRKKRNNPPSSPDATATPKSVAPASLLILILCAIGGIISGALGASPAYADVVLSPIDNPINTPNVKGNLSDWFGTWGNVSNFSTTTPTGQSTLQISPDCKTLTLSIIGASSGGICRNASAGLHFKTYIDGKPANIAARLAEDDSGYSSSIYTPYSGGNEYITMAERGGSRFAYLQLQAPVTTSTSSGFLHKVDVHVGSIGSHGNIWTSFDRGIGDCAEAPGEPCYILLSGTYSCQPPPTPPPPPACSQQCSTVNDCAGNLEGCVECRPSGLGGISSESGSLMTCQPPPPPACNSFCASNNDCAKNTEGCTECVAGQCRIPPACNVACTKDDQCTGAKDGCTSCLPSDTGTGNVCRPTAACNVACTKDGQCAGAKDGCTACVGGVCKVPPACGVACTTKAECGGAKDGCSECMEGTCTDFSDNMCKCDGIVADVSYPSSAFKFEAFGKVEGANVKKAEIADITFRMTKDNQVIAKSNPITPEIVEDTAAKRRFKAAWQTAPPAADKNSTYRVFADVRCKPKKIVASTNEPTSSRSQAVATPQIKQLPAPKGLVLITTAINKAFAGNNETVKAATARLLIMFSACLLYTSPSPRD